MSLVLSRLNLTPIRTPPITMATTTAHVTPMITYFHFWATRDFFPPSESLVLSAWNRRYHKQTTVFAANGENVENFTAFDCFKFISILCQTRTFIGSRKITNLNTVDNISCRQSCVEFKAEFGYLTRQITK